MPRTPDRVYGPSLEEELQLEDRTSDGSPTVEGAMRLVAGRVEGFLSGVVQKLNSASSFTYKPGATQGGDLYSTWDDLYARIQETEGLITIDVDDSVTSPAVISGSSGPYDLSRVSFQGSISLTPTLDVDAVLSSLPYKIGPNIWVNNDRAAGPAFTSTVFSLMFIEGGLLGTNNTHPLIDVAGANVTIFGEGFTAIAANGPTFNVQSPRTLLIIADSDASVPSTTVDGDGTLTFQCNSTAAVLDEQGANVNFTGTASTTVKTKADKLFVDTTTFTQSTADNAQQVMKDLDGAIAGGGITEAQHKTLRHLIHFIDEGPGDGFATGATKTVTGGLFPTNIKWIAADSNYIVEKIITRSGGGATNLKPTPIKWKAYDGTGNLTGNVLFTISDAVTYSGVSETARTRTISAGDA